MTTSTMTKKRSNKTSTEPGTSAPQPPAASATSAPAAASATSARKNVPSHEIFLVEGDGKDTVWTKVGVAFPTKSGLSHRVLVGKKGDPQQKVYLVCPNSQFDAKDNSRPGDEPRRIPYATIFDATHNNVDFKRKDGVAFLNRDDSLSLLIGEKGDKNQQKLQMRAVRSFKKAASA